MSNRFIVMSGIPASGKTSLGSRLANALALPFLDKDQILESLFDALGTGDLEWRQRLSRASDRVLESLALSSPAAVVCSFWRHPGMPGHSGTPIEWLASREHALVEIYCRCDPVLAASRFAARSRHPGHLDAERGTHLGSQFEQLASLGPLGIGRLITADTNAAIALEPLLEHIENPDAA